MPDFKPLVLHQLFELTVPISKADIAITAIELASWGTKEDDTWIFEARGGSLPIPVLGQRDADFFFFFSAINIYSDNPYPTILIGMVILLICPYLLVPTKASSPPCYSQPPTPQFAFSMYLL